MGSLTVQTIVDADGNVVASRSALVDITERKSAEENERRVSRENAVLAEIGRIIASSRSVNDVYEGFAEQVNKLVQFDQIDVATADPEGGTLRVEYASGPRIDDIAGQQGFTRPLKGTLLEMVIGRGTGILSVPRDKDQLFEERPESARAADEELSSLIAVPLIDGGKLTIETSNVVLGVGQAGRRVDLDPGAYVMISVQDTDTGIAYDIRDHLFEPFFTTREVGKGTGLGLATCYGIIKQSGGDIDFRSELGEGTTFHVYLPSLGVDVSDVQFHGERDLPRGSETVLLVEDEPAVCGLAAYVLRHQGYTVLEAENGEEALRVAQAHSPDIIDLLLTDVVMPRMGGKELADHFHKELPETKIMFTSGYPGGGVPKGVDLDPGTPMLAKPFMPDAVAAKVREVLDSPVLVS
jgi:two-component system cell cycle sensor histidine kinase/response regulator CckA